VMVDPLFEIGLRGWVIVLDVVIQALEAVLRIEVKQTVFKWVLYVTAPVENLVVAARAVDVAGQQRHHVIHHLLVAGKDDVGTAGVIGKALLLNGLAVPSAAAVFLQHLAVVLQVRGNANTRQPAA